jgi:hypothetical protein
MNNAPILRLQLDGLRAQIMHQLGDLGGEMNASVEAQIKAYLTPETLTDLIADAVSRTIPQAINDAVKVYFSYGPGKDTIKIAVTHMLEGPTDE